MTDTHDITTVIERFYHWEKNIRDSIFLRQPQDGKWTDITFGEAGLSREGLKRGAQSWVSNFTWQILKL